MTTPYQTQPPTPTAQITSEPHPLPPASTFDILPPLHALLNRLLIPNPTSTISQGDPSDTASIAGDSLKSDEYLDIQHLAAASAAVRVRIAKARAAIKGLPDVDRSIAEQEAEIRELEGRIEGMRGVLGNVGRG